MIYRGWTIDVSHLSPGHRAAVAAVVNPAVHVRDVAIRRCAVACFVAAGFVPVENLDGVSFAAPARVRRLPLWTAHALAWLGQIIVGAAYFAGWCLGARVARR